MRTHEPLVWLALALTAAGCREETYSHIEIEHTPPSDEPSYTLTLDDREFTGLPAIRVAFNEDLGECALSDAITLQPRGKPVSFSLPFEDTVGGDYDIGSWRVQDAGIRFTLYADPILWAADSGTVNVEFSGVDDEIALTFADVGFTSDDGDVLTVAVGDLTTPIDRGCAIVTDEETCTRVDDEPPWSSTYCTDRMAWLAEEAADR